MLKKCKVVMLPTNQKADHKCVILLNKGSLILPLTGAEARRMQVSGHQANHIYILSKDKIKERDWFVKMRGRNGKPSLYKEKNNAFLNSKWLNSPDVKDCFKVIATTDNSLNLPQPSQAFINKYVDLYNKGQQIEEVEVEYKLVGHSTTLGIENWEPKVSSDNTITIRKIKDSYTREEVVLLLLDFGEFVLDNSILPNRKSVQEWLEKNL